MDKYWWFGPGSWWCKFSHFCGHPEWCLYPPDPIPPEPPKPPEPPEPEPEPIPEPTPEPTIPKLPESMTYPKSGKIVAPFLIPTLGINRLIKDNNYINFLNRIVNNRWGNTLRIFSAGMWEPHWKNKLNFPYEKASTGKFNPLKVNRDWINLLIKRISQAVERGIFVIVTMQDNCSLKENRNGYWKEHWQNGLNNLGDMSIWMPGIYHYYEDNWHDYDYIRTHREKRTIAGLDKNPTDKQIKDWIHKLDNTGTQVEVDNHYLVEVLTSRFGDKIGFEGVNEGPVGNQWHNIQLILLFNEFAIPKHRRFTSVQGAVFYNKPTIKSKFTLSVHGIGNIDQYEEGKGVVPDNIPFIASSDGCTPPENPEVWKDLVFQVLISGNVGFESNLRPIFELENGKWKNVCGKEDWSLESMEWRWADAIRDGWFKFLES